MLKLEWYYYSGELNEPELCGHYADLGPYSLFVPYNLGFYQILLDTPGEWDDVVCEVRHPTLPRSDLMEFAERELSYRLRMAAETLDSSWLEAEREEEDSGGSEPRLTQDVAKENQSGRDPGVSGVGGEGAASPSIIQTAESVMNYLMNRSGAHYEFFLLYGRSPTEQELNALEQVYWSKPMSADLSDDDELVGCLYSCVACGNKLSGEECALPVFKRPYRCVDCRGTTEPREIQPVAPLQPTKSQNFSTPPIYHFTESGLLANGKPLQPSGYDQILAAIKAEAEEVKL